MTLTPAGVSETGSGKAGMAVAPPEATAAAMNASALATKVASSTKSAAQASFTLTGMEKEVEAVFTSRSFCWA